MLQQTDDLQLEFYKLMLQIFISYQKSLAISICGHDTGLTL